MILLPPKLTSTSRYSPTAASAALVFTLAYILFRAGHDVIAVLLLYIFSIVANFYVSIWLVRRDDRMVGGMPKATHSYCLGFVIIVFAYSCIAASLFDPNRYLLLTAIGVGSVLGAQIVFAFAMRQVNRAIVVGGFTSA